MAYARTKKVVFPVNPVKLLENDPAPVPSVVLVFAIVGFEEVDQQTPRAVILAPPSLVIVPPEEAVVWVMAEMAVVVTVSIPGLVVKLTAFP